MTNKQEPQDAASGSSQQIATVYDNQRILERLEDMTTILNYCVIDSENPQEALRLLPVADRLGIKDMLKKMALVIMKIITIANCIEIFQIAENIGLEELWENTYRFILENFQEVITINKDFHLLTFDELCSLFLSDELMVDSEDVVFKSIERWVNSNLASRIFHLPELIKLVRLPCCDTNALMRIRDHHLLFGFELATSSVRLAIEQADDVVMTRLAKEMQRGKNTRRRRLEKERGEEEQRKREVEEKVREEEKERRKMSAKKRNKEVQKDEEQTWRRDIEKKLKKLEEREERARLEQRIVFLEEEDLRRNKTKADIFLFGGLGSSAVEILYKSENCWVEERNIANPPRGKTWSAPIGRTILVIEASGRKVRLFNPYTNKWKARSPLPYDSFKEYFSVAALNGRVYVMGGELKGVKSASCHSYNPSKDKWSKIASLNVPRIWSGAVAFKGKIYCAGGRGKEGILASVEIYDPEWDEWTISSVSLDSDCFVLCMAKCDNFIWAFGGYNSNAVQRFNPKEEKTRKKWEVMSPMSTCRFSATAAFMGGLFYVIGGYESGKSLDSTEVYDPVLKVWKEGPKLLESRWDASCTVFRL